MRKLILMSFACLALAACQTAGTGTVGSGGFNPLALTTVCATSTADEKALWVIEAFYNAPASAYRSANSRGLINAGLKAQIKPKLQTLGGYVLKARAARKACDLVALNQYGAAAQTLRDEVLPLIPR